MTAHPNRWLWLKRFGGAINPIVSLWLEIRPIKRLKERRRKRKAMRERPADEANEFFQSDEDLTMFSNLFSLGALKSKLVWLGIAQVAYSLFETWASGGLNAEAVSTAVSGVLTILFRAVTSTPLADK